LHFDGKSLEEKIEGKVVFVEHQVVVLKNNVDEIRIGVLVLPDGKSKTIYDAIKELLEFYNLWSSIKMIVSDTCNVNTGRHQGVAVLLSKEIEKRSSHVPLQVGCELHILDTLLRHCLDQLFGTQSSGPLISYWFVKDIVGNYSDLKQKFNSDGTRIEITEETVAWRDDMRFLKHLCNAYKHFKEFNHFPKIQFQTLPHMSNARWNSRAIFALLAFILLPNKRGNEITAACDFILDWSKAWFTNHMFDSDAYPFLYSLTSPYPKARRSLETHWCRVASPVESERTNACAERAVKAVTEFKKLCRSNNSLNARFILSNK